ncbi:cytochrome P450 [Mycena belliarum]|uniref:Cytochrome P450 n=1 Tax=Mycena belliarum TaxID=1033014 RepID=A0AAD6XNH3_9AGAR|nr:cytochrome P450 [Mycena belliae]
MTDFLRVATYGSAGILGAYILGTVFYAPSLDSIPAIGPSGILSSYVGAYRYIRYGKDMIDQGYSQHRVFRVPLIHRWDVIISGSQLVEELRASKEEELSIREAFNEILQTDMTMGPNILGNPYHISVARVGMTKNIDARFDEVRDEIMATFDDHLAMEGDEWKAVPVQSTTMQVICRTSNRLFVGLPLCRNRDYLNINFEFTISVVIAAQLINLLPGFLRPIIGPWLSPLKKYLKRTDQQLGALVTERVRLEEELGNEYPGRPNDLISWLLDEAEGDERTVPALVQRILVINFGAVHTSANTFAHALFDLAAFPSSVEEMREEAAQIVREEGWSKTSVFKMHKIDSFLRESQRYNGNSITSMGRKVVKSGGFTFSDGTTVPAGCFVNVATGPTHHDPNIYPNPNEFDALRFYNLRLADEEGTIRHQLAATSLEYLPWGHGRHACPGRFFAATMLKTMLAHVLLNYDVKLEDESAGRPPNQWFAAICIPNGKANVMFRKRQTM